MTTIQFVLDKEFIENINHTIDEFEKYLRDFYTKRNAIEISYLTFQRDDEDAVCDLGDIHDVMLEHPKLMKCFERCNWNVDGEEEDCIKELKNYINSHTNYEKILYGKAIVEKTKKEGEMDKDVSTLIRALDIFCGKEQNMIFLRAYCIINKEKLLNDKIHKNEFENAGKLFFGENFWIEN